MVISEAPAGRPVRDLGSVSGRELAHWTKVASTPDGDRS
jgi:hypothetical protein